MWFLPLAAILIPVVCALMIFLLREEKNIYIGLTVAAAVLFNFITVLIILRRVFVGDSMHFSFFNITGVSVVLRADYFSVIFAVLCSFLWVFSMLFFVGNMKQHNYNRRFFILYLLNLGILCGLAFSGNILTMFLFLFILTFSTFPLVAQYDSREMEKEKLESKEEVEYDEYDQPVEPLYTSDVYMNYHIVSAIGIFCTVVTMILLYNNGVIIDLTFKPGGIIGVVPDFYSNLVSIAFFLGFIGFAARSAIVPMHGWLFLAIEAAEPEVAIFHAAVMVNTGFFGIIRLIYYLYGIQWFSQSWLSFLTAFSLIAIIYGLYNAVNADDLKDLMASSAVSQMGLLTMIAAVFNSLALTAALLHFFNQIFFKITLFCCARLIITSDENSRLAETEGVDETEAAGKKLPKTMTAFAFSGLGLISILPIYWYLGQVNLMSSGMPLETSFDSIFVALVVITGGIINALYFFPFIFNFYWESPNGEDDEIGKGERFMPLPILCLTTAFGIIFALLTFPLIQSLIESMPW